MPRGKSSMKGPRLSATRGLGMPFRLPREGRRPMHSFAVYGAEAQPKVPPRAVGAAGIEYPCKSLVFVRQGLHRGLHRAGISEQFRVVEFLLVGKDVCVGI